MIPTMASTTPSTTRTQNADLAMTASTSLTRPPLVAQMTYVPSPTNQMDC
jgi:hypothetical protein